MTTKAKHVIMVHALKMNGHIHHILHHLKLDGNVALIEMDGVKDTNLCFGLNYHFPMMEETQTNGRFD